MNILAVLHLFRRLFLTVDINDEAIHLLEISSRGESFQIEKAFTQTLPTGCVSQQRIIDVPLFTTLLSSAVDSLKPKQRYASIALPLHQVMTKTLFFLADLSSAEIDEQIQQDIINLSPAPPHDIYWDYQKSCYKKSFGDHEKPSSQKITLVMVQRAIVQRYQEIFTHAGLHLHTINIESVALAQAWHHYRPHHPPSPPNAIEALLLVRSQLITLVILCENEVLHARARPLDPSHDPNTALLHSASLLWEEFSSLMNSSTPSFLWLVGNTSNDILSNALNRPVFLFPEEPSVLVNLGLALPPLLDRRTK